MKWDPRVSSACLLHVCALALGFQLCCRVREDLVECDCSMSCRCCCSENLCLVLADMLEFGADLYEDIRKAKRCKKLPVPKAQAAELLRNREPW